MKIILPWPPKELSPNARVHWSKRAKFAKLYRQTCMVITRGTGEKVDWEGDIHLFIDFYPPDRRRYDDDNLSSRLNAGRDGIADALGVDDRRFRAHPYLQEEVRPGGQVVVKLCSYQTGAE